MAQTGRIRLPVIDSKTLQPCGVITVEHLLGARVRAYEAETHRARTVWVQLPVRSRSNGNGVKA
jgi:hypothetical protein